MTTEPLEHIATLEPQLQPSVLSDKQLARLEARIKASAARIAEEQAYHAQMCEVRDFNYRIKEERKI